MNRRFLINTTAVVFVVLMLVLFSRTIQYQPARTTLPGAPSSQTADAPEAAPPADGDAVTPGLVAPSGDLAAAAALVRHAAIGFRTPERLAEHFEKHGAEFGGLTADGYLLMAQALRDRPAGGDVLEMVREDGVITRFDRATGAFIAFDRDFTIRTFFRPVDGEAYYHRQSRRE